MGDTRPMCRAVFAVFFIFAIGTAARGSEERTRVSPVSTSGLRVRMEQCSGSRSRSMCSITISNVYVEVMQ